MKSTHILFSNSVTDYPETVFQMNTIRFCLATYLISIRNGYRSYLSLFIQLLESVIHVMFEMFVTSLSKKFHRLLTHIFSIITDYNTVLLQYPK